VLHSEGEIGEQLVLRDKNPLKNTVGDALTLFTTLMLFHYSFVFVSIARPINLDRLNTPNNYRWKLVNNPLP
jgi:hypothetical protein